MKNYSLGEFEEMILLVVAGSDGEAYGVTIQENLVEHLKKCKYQCRPCVTEATGGERIRQIQIWRHY